VTASTHPDRRVTAHGWLRAVLDRSDLPQRARLVAAALFARMDPDGTCWPSLATVSAAAGYARPDGALAGLDTLEAAGWLIRERRRRADGSPATTRYVAVVPAESVDPDEPVGPPVDPTEGAPEGLGRGLQGASAVVDNRPGGSMRPRGGAPSTRGVELASDLATDQQPRPPARRRRRRGRPPTPAPSWRLVESPDGRLYAVEGVSP
jgi:hypothetical protein